MRRAQKQDLPLHYWEQQSFLVRTIKAPCTTAHNPRPFKWVSSVSRASTGGLGSRFTAVEYSLKAIRRLTGLYRSSTVRGAVGLPVRALTSLWSSCRSTTSAWPVCTRPRRGAAPPARNFVACSPQSLQGSVSMKSCTTLRI